MKSMKHSTYFNLLDAFEQKICPICRLSEKATNKFIDDLLYEDVNDPGIRKMLNKSGGLCRYHSGLLAKSFDGLGISIIYKNLLEILSGKMKKSPMLKTFTWKPFLDYRQQLESKCPICNNEREVEKRYILVFLKYFDEPEFFNKYEHSAGLCLPHLIKTAENCNNPKILKSIISIEQRKINNLIKQLGEFIRKNDYRFSNEKFGEERDAWRRAIEKLIGSL